MKKFVMLSVVTLLILVTATSPKAALHDRTGGLIYDDVLNITWTQNANNNGTMEWDEAITWVNDFVFQGYSDWRLPISDTTCLAYSCTGSEMGHLFYNEGITSATPDLFADVRPSMYWSGTEYTDPSKAWRFDFKTGYQGSSLKTTNRYAWAVRDGDSAPSAPPVAPEPISSVLFITGGAALGIRRYWNGRLNPKGC